MTAPEGQTQHLLTVCREHYCNLNAIHYRLQINFYAAGGLEEQPSFLCAPLNKTQENLNIRYRQLMEAGGRNKVLQSAYHCPITCLGHWDYCKIPFPLNDPTT